MIRYFACHSDRSSAEIRLSICVSELFMLDLPRECSEASASYRVYYRLRLWSFGAPKGIREFTSFETTGKWRARLNGLNKSLGAD